MQTNMNMLRGKIIERGYTQQYVAQQIGIDKSTFSRKMQSSALDFSIGEMYRIVDMLQLTNEEAQQIFLSDNSHLCENKVG